MCETEEEGVDGKGGEGGREGGREGGQPSYLDDRAENEHDEEDDGDEALEDVHDFFSLSVLCACEERCVKKAY